MTTNELAVLRCLEENAGLWLQLEHLRNAKNTTYECFQKFCRTQSLKSFPHHFCFHKYLMHDFNMTK